jgi:(p)ppGpp synthase/HD superfamily hydrolase
VINENELMANLQRAIEIAVLAHRGQLQKDGLPYVLHPLSLMFSVKSVDAKMAAVLHDVVEDTEITHDDLQKEGFPKSVLEAVHCLTHRDGEAYDNYIERIKQDEIAREVKLADLRDNMSMPRIPELADRDLARMKKYHRAWRDLGGDVG